MDLAASQPDALAYVEKGQRITYEGLARRVRATAAWLDRAGVRKGDTVALSFDAAAFTGSLRSLQFFYALAALGAVVLPLYPDVPPSERLALLARFGARWLIPRDRTESSASCVLLDPEACDWRGIERDRALTPRGDDPTHPLLLQFSGGTTGAPKVVAFRHEQYLANMLVGAAEIGATAADRVVSSRPWPTLPGVRNLVRILSIGGAFINARFPETSEALDDVIGETGATVLVASPWQLRRMLSSARSTRRPRREPRVLYVAGAFISPEELKAAREAITRNIYSATAAPRSASSRFCARTTRSSPWAMSADWLPDCRRRPLTMTTGRCPRARSVTSDFARRGSPIVTSVTRRPRRRIFATAGSIPATSAPWMPKGGSCSRDEPTT